MSQPSVVHEPDLFDFLIKAYNEWNTTGKVTIRYIEYPIVLDEVPNGLLESFAAFARKYLKLNPISTTGQTGADFGVGLCDGTRLAIARGTATVFAMEGRAISTLGSRSFTPPLPPANAIPINGPDR